MIIILVKLFKSCNWIQLLISSKKKKKKKKKKQTGK